MSNLTAKNGCEFEANSKQLLSSLVLLPTCHVAKPHCWGAPPQFEKCWSLLRPYYFHVQWNSKIFCQYILQFTQLNSLSPSWQHDMTSVVEIGIEIYFFFFPFFCYWEILDISLSYTSQSFLVLKFKKHLSSFLISFPFHVQNVSETILVSVLLWWSHLVGTFICVVPGTGFITRQIVQCGHFSFWPAALWHRIQMMVHLMGLRKGLRNTNKLGKELKAIYTLK